MAVKKAVQQFLIVNAVGAVGVLLAVILTSKYVCKQYILYLSLLGFVKVDDSANFSLCVVDEVTNSFDLRP